jgi:BASS family bile acid:Na+ symporter
VALLIDIGVPLITFLALTAVGMDLTVDDFHRVRRQRAVLAAGLGLPLLLLPLLAIALLAVMKPAPHVAAGLLLVAACPIGGISNTYSYLAGASTALSVTLTTVSSAAAFITIPAVSWVLEAALDGPLGFSAPAMLPVQLAFMVLLPVMVGMAIRRRWSAFAIVYRAKLQAGAIVALSILISIVIVNDVRRFVGGLADTVPTAVLFVAASFGTGWLVGGLVRASPADRFTLATEFATRNIAVATAIAFTLLRQPAFAYFGTIYFMFEAPVLLVAVALYRNRASQGLTRQTAV